MYIFKQLQELLLLVVINLENYINSNTSLDTFLYLFGNIDNVPEHFYIEWLASLKELHVLIDVFWKS